VQCPRRGGCDQDRGRCLLSVLYVILNMILKMDNRFYNIDKKKKIGEWVVIHTTGSTDYDLGLFYMSGVVRELLQTYYYAKINLSKTVPQEIYEIKRENYEFSFIHRIFCAHLDINLYKLIDTNKKAWSFIKLQRVTREFNWGDKDEIENAIHSFSSKLKEHKLARHQRHAHISQQNKPNVIHVSARLERYQIIIREAMELLDRFVDGKIPYSLYYSEIDDCDLREIILSE
jgi:hypothetical protein